MSNRMSPTSTLSQNILNNNNHHAQSQPMQIINNSIQETSSLDSTNNTTNSHHVAGFMSPTLISEYCHLMSLGNSSNSMDNNNNSSRTSAVDDAFTHMMDYSKNRVSSFLPLSEIMANDQESIRNETVSKILTEHDIDNLIRVMSFHPEFLKEFVEFYNFLMYGRYGALASDARHFIAMMAASRHKCIYLVEQQEREFLVHNGPKSWLRGLDHVPSKLKDLLELNKLLCHRPWAVNSSHIEKILKSSNSWTLNELITAVVIIIQFHALAGLAFGCGVNENYLQQLAVKRLEDRKEVSGKKVTGSGSGGNGQGGKVRNKQKGEAKEADYVLEEDDDDADLLVVERDEATTTTTTTNDDEDESDLDEDFYDDEDLYDENDKNKSATMMMMTATATSELFGEKEVVRNVNESSSGNHSLEEVDYESHHRLAGLNGPTFQYTSQRTLSDSSASSCELGLDMLVKEMQLIKDQNGAESIGDKNNNSINIISMSHESPQTTITNNTPSSNNHSYQTNELLDHHIIHSKRKHKSDDSDSAQQSLDLKKPSPSSLSPVKSTRLLTSSSSEITTDSSRFLNTASIRERKDLYMQRFTTDMNFGYIECEKDDESLKLEYFTWENQGYVTAYNIQPDMSDSLDKTFKVAANMTYNTMGTFKDVDTSLFRRAIWHYIHMLFGVRYDDYDYKQIKLLLKSPLRKYIRIVCTCPERVTRRHYDSIMREFRHSEKVHLNLVIMEARVQCALLYFLRSVNSFYGS